jgi:hypothetical protein
VGVEQQQNESSTTGSPRGPGSFIPSPLRNSATARPRSLSQKSSVISSPDGVNQLMSGIAARLAGRRTGRPVKNRRRRNTGCRARNAVSVRTNSISRSSASSQSIQVSSLSWQ